MGFIQWSDWLNPRLEFQAFYGDSVLAFQDWLSFILSPKTQQKQEKPYGAVLQALSLLVGSMLYGMHFGHLQLHCDIRVLPD